MNKKLYSYSPYSVQRQQDIGWDGWGSADSPMLPEGSNLSGDNNKEVDSLVSDLFQETSGLPGDNTDVISEY